MLSLFFSALLYIAEQFSICGFLLIFFKNVTTEHPKVFFRTLKSYSLSKQALVLSLDLTTPRDPFGLEVQRAGDSPPYRNNIELITDHETVPNLSSFVGNLLKQKKKGLFSKWNKRYCILRDHFLFYYRSEQESKALGVVVLPGYNITPEKTKFTFKITPTGKGRSTYLVNMSYSLS